MTCLSLVSCGRVSGFFPPEHGGESVGHLRDQRHVFADGGAYAQSDLHACCIAVIGASPEKARSTVGSSRNRKLALNSRSGEPSRLSTNLTTGGLTRSGDRGRLLLNQAIGTPRYCGWAAHCTELAASCTLAGVIASLRCLFAPNALATRGFERRRDFATTTPAVLFTAPRNTFWHTTI